MTTPAHAHLLSDKIAIRRFALAGRAVLTLKNAVTGQHFAFKVAFDEDARVFRVDYLGAGRERVKMGIICGRGLYFRGGWSTIEKDDARNAAFSFVWGAVNSRRALPPALEIWHQGACARCALPLTDPASIERGFGPDCWAVILACATLQTRLYGLLLTLADGYDVELPAPLALLPRPVLTALLRLLATGRLAELAQARELALAACLPDDAVALLDGVIGVLITETIGASDTRKALRAAIGLTELHPFFSNDRFAALGLRAEAA
jgi:hypothetical protein